MNTELILFVATATIVILNIFQLFGIMFGNSISYPALKLKFITIGPTQWFIMYPSFFYQVWFWTIKLHILI